MPSAGILLFQQSCWRHSLYISPVSVTKINKYNLLFPWILLIESSLFAILEHGKMRILDVGKGEGILLLRQMKYFTAVVDCNSFTEAAEQCYISQSAISQQIRVLEKDLGVELIRRENRRFSLTPAGEYFYQQSKGILEEVEQMRRETIRLGQDLELQLCIGYLRCYSGQELYQAVADFSRIYPEVAISIVNGTHEELYDLLRVGNVDLVFTDQRRAFSDKYFNVPIQESGCYAEVSVRSDFAHRETLEVAELRRTPCILISSRDQLATEQEYYKNILGFGGTFLSAESLEEGRLMVAGNRGFLPVDGVGTLPPTGSAIRRLPVLSEGKQITRTYGIFWGKDRTNYYIEEFAGILKRLLCGEKQSIGREKTEQKGDQRNG